MLADYLRAGMLAAAKTARIVEWEEALFLEPDNDKLRAQTDVDCVIVIANELGARHADLPAPDRLMYVSDSQVRTIGPGSVLYGKPVEARPHGAPSWTVQQIDAWSLALDPRHIATTCSARHVQSVIEILQRNVAYLTTLVTCQAAQIEQKEVRS